MHCIPLFWCNIEAEPNKLCVSVSKPNFSCSHEREGWGGGVLETSPSEHIQIEGVGVEEREGQSRVKCLKRQTEKERGEKKEEEGGMGREEETT